MMTTSLYLIAFCAVVMAQESNFSLPDRESNLLSGRSSNIPPRPHVLIYEVERRPSLSLTTMEPTTMKPTTTTRRTTTTTTTTTTRRPTTTTRRPTTTTTTRRPTTTTTTRRPTTTTTRKPTTLKPVTTAAPNKPIASDLELELVLETSPFTCRGLKNGHYADVHFECKFFHQCQFVDKDGEIFIQQTVFGCGFGTKFNQTLRTCDYADKVTCDSATVDDIIQEQLNAVTPTAGPTSSPEPLPITTFSCDPDKHRGGFLYADEESNCQLFHRCFYKPENELLVATKYSFSCPRGTAFDQKTISCTNPAQVNCDNSKQFWDAQVDFHPKY